MASNFDSQRIVKFLCQQLFSQVPSVRRQIAVQLGDIGDEIAIPHLMDAIRQDPDKLVCQLAVEALGKIYQKIEHGYEQDKAIFTLQQTIADIQNKQTASSRTNINNIIDVEFTVIHKKDPAKWQLLMDGMSVIFAGGVEATKILSPIAGIPIEVLKRLYEIWSRNKKF
jgi:tetrahydromethanopterin S-methyltransferase subunit A